MIFFGSINTIFTERETYEKRFGNERRRNHILRFHANAACEGSKNLKFVSGNIKEFIEHLKNQESKDIYLIDGELAKTFFAENLIDEIVLGVQAKIIGSGIPLFLPHERQMNMELVDVKTRCSGSVQLSYRVKTRISRFV